MNPKVIAALLVTVMQIQWAHAQSSVGNFLTGSAKVESVEPNSQGQIVPKPDRVVIHDFTVRTDDITLDHSIAGSLRRHRLLRHGNDEDSTPQVLAQHVQAAFCKALTDQLEKDHIAAERASGEKAEGGVSSLVVDGEFTAIDEGSKSERVMIGFGSGASDLKTHVNVSSVRAGHSMVVLTFDLDSKSGKKPGAIPGVVTGSLAVDAAKKAVGDKKSTVDADASRMAQLVAKQIESLMGDRTGPAGPPAEAAGTTLAGRSAG
ncbi:hypothetical protein SBC1_39980 (plasmid) [Caballeronia sp. SBC1]|uniref:DUF4410 domain-containing protein n=1 Tax=unclassified Caballeronia TaxID=2646786 RepID=UPI0013E203B0|nr:MULTISPECIES: DUF4410 domain-containing protein [unclassified Caballeronia]QIE26726.1 hypothetical protein SBC2_47960 [Caballeronia sp. SBC2]QIN63958.1 hypothetical protein SBC1_39980 [Caballeronia sp. SBC1]